MSQKVVPKDFFQSDDFKFELGKLTEIFGYGRFEKRTKEFEVWIADFIEESKDKNAQLLNGMSIREMAIYLNFFYWRLVHNYVKKQVASSKKGASVLISRYKIAATKVYVIRLYEPFENSNGEPILSMNIDFALYICSRVLFSWDIANIDIPKIKQLLEDDEATRDFIEEHKLWIEHHCLANQATIFSNMQTYRLLHYWFREPKFGLSPSYSDSY